MVTKSKVRVGWKLIADWGQSRERKLMGRRPRKFWVGGGGSGNDPYLDRGGVPWEYIFGYI